MKVDYEKAIQVNNELQFNVDEQQDEEQKNISKINATQTMKVQFRK